MKKILILLIFLTACSAAGSNKRIKIAMKDLECITKPGSEHKLLSSLPGKWKARSKYWFSPNSEPQESTANVTREWILDGRFIKETYDDTSLKHPFQGIGVIGYDKVQKVFQSTWIDTMSTGVSISTGEVNETGNTFTFEGESPDPLTGGLSSYRSVMKILSDDTTTYEMYMKDRNGKEFQSLEIVYIKQ